MKCGKKISKKRLKKALIEASFGKLLAYMKYKSGWRGIKLTEADRYFASSKLCSSCYCKNEDLNSEEKWTCSKCGTVHDRDFNASINLYNYEKILPLIKQRENVPDDTGIAMDIR